MEVKGQAAHQAAQTDKATTSPSGTDRPQERAAQGIQSMQEKSVAAQKTPVSQPTNPEGKLPAGRRRSGILFISRSQLSVYVEGMTSVAVLPFPPEVVRDLDVINEEVLYKQIAALVTQHQIPTANFSAVLANQTLFSRQVTATDPAQKKVDEEKYLSTIPFDSPAVSHVTMGQNVYVVVANKGLFEPIDRAFEKVGSDLILALPEFLFPKDLNLPQGLSMQSAEILLKKVHDFKEFNFIHKEVTTDENGASQEESNKKLRLQVTGGKSNKKLVIGGVLFMVFGVILAGVLFIQQSQPLPVPPSVGESTAPTAIPVTVQSNEASGSGESLPASPSGDVQGVTSPTILINYQQGSEERAEAIRLRLRNLNFSPAFLRETAITASVTHVAYDSNLSQAMVELITSQVQELEDDVRAIKTTTSGSDIVITLASN